MFDFILGLYLAGLMVRGWMRGLVREALGLVGLVLGTWVAFRLSAPLGDFLTQSFGTTPEFARVGAGIVLFLLFGTALSVGAHFLTKVMRLPGLTTANRVGGGAVAFAWGVALLLVVVNVARVLPLPDSWDRQVEDSVVAGAIAGPEAMPQRLFHRLAGDSALTALYAIQSLFGTNRIVPLGGQVVEIPQAQPDEIRQVRDEAMMILEEVNRHRAGEGVSALQTSTGLEGLAERRAVDSYLTGELTRDLDCAPEAEAVAGVRVARCADVLALAGTSLAALDAILSTSETAAAVSNPGFDRTGIAVVDGPTGRLLVIVLAG